MEFNPENIYSIQDYFQNKCTSIDDTNCQNAKGFVFQKDQIIAVSNNIK